MSERRAGEGCGSGDPRRPYNMTKSPRRSGFVTISTVGVLIVHGSERGGEFVTFCRPSRHVSHPLAAPFSNAARPPWQRLEDTTARGRGKTMRHSRTTLDAAPNPTHGSSDFSTEPSDCELTAWLRKLSTIEESERGLTP